MIAGTVRKDFAQKLQAPGATVYTKGTPAGQPAPNVNNYLSKNKNTNSPASVFIFI